MILVLWSTACNTADSTKHAKPQNPMISALTFYPGTLKISATDCSLAHTNRCQVCFDDDQLRVPHEDERCPLQDCGVLNSLELQTEGLEQVCLEHRYDNPVFACLPEGTCAKEASVDVCERTSTEVVARAYGPCSFIEGCHEGGTVGFRWAKDGTACPGGTCSTGQCLPERKAVPKPVVPTTKCAIFPAAPFCKEGRITAHLNYCEFRVTTPSYRTCAEICQAHGARCLRGWDDARDSCERQDSYGCHVRELDQICRCEVPSSGMRLAVPGKLPTP